MAMTSSAGRHDCAVAAPLRSYRCRHARLDGRAHQAAPLGPRPVIVLHRRISQELVQHEPRMGATLANAAIRDCRFLWRDALAAVDLPQVACGLEGTVVGDGGGP